MDRYNNDHNIIKHPSAVLDDVINESFKYASTLVGVKFKWWTGENVRDDGEPFWVGEGPVPHHIIKACGCTGLLNLVRRKNNLLIPGTDDPTLDFPGGTKVWFDFLCKKSIEHKCEVTRYDASKTYVKGSILMCPYINMYNQGHVAIVHTDNTKIIHSYPNVIKKDFSDEGLDPGVVIEPIEKSHFGWTNHKADFGVDGYYQFVFPPETWLV